MAIPPAPDGRDRDPLGYDPWMSLIRPSIALCPEQMIGSKTRMQGKALPEHRAETRVYVGIDVCKDRLDVYVHPLGHRRQLSNTAEGLEALKLDLAGPSVALIVMEATGKYHRLAQRTLDKAGLAVAVVSPLRARRFAEAIGQVAKTDRLDAKVLAIMGQSIEPKAMEPVPEALEALQELVRARVVAVADRTALINQQHASQTPFLKAELGRRLKALDTSIARLEAEIERRIKADPSLKRRYDILISIPGVGPVAAIAMIVGLPELGTCSGKAVSLLAGLAPLAVDSGNVIGERHIKGGRGHVRIGIYFAALTASRFNPHFIAFYKRLIAAGKKPKVALTAIMRKLIVLANVLIHEDRLWTPNSP